ncbi:MAG: nitrogen fixation protein [Alphaproteobacteria bacterium]|nr:nitrogen fixation protein [Alphaproteobacteria bacterium]
MNMTEHKASAAHDIKVLLAADDLAGAVARMIDAVRQAPQDLQGRLLLTDLLILSGDLERADKQAGVAASLAPAEAVGLSLLRREIRGMEARRRWYEEAAVPDFPDGPGEADQIALKLALALRAGDEAAVAAARETLAAMAPVQCSWNGGESGDFRDLDDRLPHALEAISSGGGYLWIDFRKIARLEFEPDARPRDLAFRRARLSLKSGSIAEILVPALYHGADPGVALRLGRETRWVDGPGGIVCGQGQRCFLAGDAMVAISEAVTIAAGEGDG